MEEATEELKTAKTKLDTTETELTEAKRKLATAEDKLVTAEDKLATAEDKLVTAQTQYDDHTVDRPQHIINDYNRAQDIVTRCSNTVNSIRAYCVTLNNTVLSLSAAAAPGKFER